MEQSNQSLSHLLFTLNRYVDSESNKWMPIEPHDSQEESFRHRAGIVEWILSLSDALNFCDETVFLAVQIFDRLLIQMKVYTKYLRIMGLTSLYLAAKLTEEDENIPVTYDLIDTSKCRYSEHELKRMECCILTKLNWSLISYPTAFQFLHLFETLLRTKCPSLGSLKAYRSIDGNDILTSALTQCLLHNQLLTHPPSIIALSVLSLYLRLIWEHWLPALLTLQAHIHITEDQLSQCSRLVEGFVDSYIRDAVMRRTPIVVPARHNFSNNNSNDNDSPKINNNGSNSIVESQSVFPESQMPDGLSVNCKAPLSNPVSPDPPAKRRRVEMDDEVYSDIRMLYELCDVEPACRLPRFREVTPMMTYAAVVRSSCACEALLHHSAALAMSVQRVASI